MKKLMLMAVAAFIAVSASAQNPAVAKQIKGAKDYQEALNLVNANLQSLSNEEKAAAYNKLVDLALAKFDKEQNTQMTNQVTKKNDPVDVAGMNAAALNALKAAIECEKFDQLPNAKGKVAPKFHKKNQDRLATSVRNQLLNAGQEAFNEKNFANGADYFGMFVKSRQSQLFSDYDFSKETNIGQVAYYAALAAYNAQDYAAAADYASQAIDDAEFGSDAMDIKVLCMKLQLKSKEDSVKYLSEIKALYDKNPASDRMFALLVEYYQATGDMDSKIALINKQVANNPSSMAWALKGENEMTDSRYAEAIEAYKKSLALNPDFIQVQYNLALCQNNQAITIKDANGGNLTAEAKALLQESIANLTKLKEKDPNREQVNWAYTLYQAYYLIGDEAHAKELESLIQ